MKFLDRALENMRKTAIPAEEAEQAAARVKARLQAEQNKVVAHPSVDRIRGCDDFRTLIPAYLSASLLSSRRLLFEDHIHECVACRKALESARAGAAGAAHSVPARSRRSSRFPLRAVFGAAAVVLLAVALAQTSVVRDFIWPIDVHAMVQVVDGNLYSLAAQEVRPIVAGQRIDRGQSVRTGAGSRAVIELADGSRIELDERTELTLGRARDGVRVQVSRGNVIVAAAHQRNGRLYVATVDSTIAVIGTVFAVNAGTKGSRVSVIEGQVEVQHGGTTVTIRPGQQIATSPVLGQVPVSQEIAWSRDQDRYLALLAAYVAASQDFGARVGSAPMRFTSKLVPLVPEDTAVFASLPNVGESLAKSYEVFKQRIAENALLAEWWPQNSSERAELDAIVGWAGRVSADLGPEIVLALPAKPDASAPLLLAETQNPSDLLAVFHTVTGQDSLFVARNADELAAAAAQGNLQLIAYVDQGLLAVSTSAKQIQRSLSFIRQPGANRFTASRLYPRLEQAYREGVGWLLAADLQQIAGNIEADAAGQLGQLGVMDAQQFIVEQKTGSGGASFQATLGFSQARRGMASWLGEPSFMGALDYVSPNAYAAAGVVTKDPLLILEDVFSILRTENDAWQKLQEYQEQNHVDLRNDLAGTLGNEFLFALDGPLLPSPAWKIIMEVNDAGRLQTTLQQSVNELNRQAALNQKPSINLQTESSGGLTFYKVASADLKTEIHYTFWMGYMIIAPNRTLLTDAIQYRNTGASLARSDKFRSELPADGRDEISGIVYQDVKSIANALPTGATSSSLGDVLPTLICLYGYPDRIMMSSKGVLSANIASAAGLAGLMEAIHPQ